jgi:hypothetical protein
MERWGELLKRTNGNPTPKQREQHRIRLDRLKAKVDENTKAIKEERIRMTGLQKLYIEDEIDQKKTNAQLSTLLGLSERTRTIQSSAWSAYSFASGQFKFAERVQAEPEVASTPNAPGKIGTDQDGLGKTMSDSKDQTSSKPAPSANDSPPVIPQVDEASNQIPEVMDFQEPNLNTEK